MALEALQKAGYSQVINEGGYEDLLKKPKRLDLHRRLNIDQGLGA